MAHAPFPQESEIEDFHIRQEVRNCLDLAHRAQAAAAAGDRLTAARSAVDLVKAYDRLQDRIQLVSLTVADQARVRDRLMPVSELLRKYRLR